MGMGYLRHSSAVKGCLWWWWRWKLCELNNHSTQDLRNHIWTQTQSSLILTARGFIRQCFGDWLFSFCLIDLLDEVQWKADIYSVLHGDKIVVSFNTSLVADRHNIQLRNRTHPLKAVEGRGVCFSSIFHFMLKSIQRTNQHCTEGN